MNPLIQAINNNNVNQLKLLLDLGHDPDGGFYKDLSNDQLRTPLSFAFEKRNRKCAEVLLKAGAVPDDIFDQVVIAFNYDWCHLILKYGADPDQFVDLYWDSPLHFPYQHYTQYPLSYFARNNRTKLIKLFLTFGADVNTGDHEGHTPVFFAIRWKSLQALKTLMEHGGDIEAEDDEGCTPIHHAAMNDYHAGTKLLVAAGVNVNKQDNQGKTALFYAVEYNAYVVAQELLGSKDTDIVIKDNNGRTAIFALADTNTDNTLEMVNLLIKHGLSLNITDHTGMSLIACMIVANKPNTVKYLLKEGARVKRHERINNIPIAIYATKHYHFEDATILELIKQDINLDERDNNGDTLLFIALKTNRKSIVKALLEKGVNLNARNKNGEHALTYAIRYSKLDLFYMIYMDPRHDYVLSDSEISILIKASVKVAHFDLLNLLQSSYPDTFNELASSCLHDVVMKKSVAMAEFLIETGVDVNKPNENNVTPLFFAARNNLTEIAQLLIDHGGEADYCNDFSITPLIEAAKYNSTEVAKLLIQKGANIAVVDWEGFTALDHAQRRNNKEIILEIERHVVRKS